MPTPIIPPQPPEYELPPEPMRPLLTSTQAVWDLWFAWARLKDAQVRRTLDYQREVLCVTAQFSAADAQRSVAEAMTAATAFAASPQRWTEEQTVRQLMFGLVETGIWGNLAVARARATAASFGDAYPAPQALQPSAAEPSGPPPDQPLPPAIKPHSGVPS